MAQNKPIQRPKDKRKKKNLTIQEKRKDIQSKNQITINQKGEIIHKPPHSPGRKNDYAILKIKHPVLSEELMVFYDLGYLGVEKDFENQISILPYKKRVGKRVDCISEGME